MDAKKCSGRCRTKPAFICQLSLQRNKGVSINVRQFWVGCICISYRPEVLLVSEKKWKVSIQAMIYRTHQLKMISNNQYQYLMRQVSKNGWRQKEPEDDAYILSESIFQGAIDLLIEQKVLTAKQILELFKRNGVTLYSNDIEELLHLHQDTLKVEEKVIPMLQLRKKSKDDRANDLRELFLRNEL